MSADDKFLAWMWSLLAAVVMTLILTMGGYAAQKTRVLKQLVEEQHVDPMRASCALDIGERKESICGALAAK